MRLPPHHDMVSAALKKVDADHSSMTLLELAERCEAATGPDCVLDAMIDMALNLTPNEAESPPLTASLDAAMTLVPEGWVVGNVQESNPRTEWVVELRRGHLTSYDKVIFSNHEPGRLCKSLALAFCAAALRARASQGDSNGNA